MGKWKHIMSEVDPQARTGVCEACGSVALRSKGPGKWGCQNGKRSRHHGLTPTEMRALTDGAKCAVCGLTGSLKVDHEHASGKIRGVLCHGCNVAIGHMRDDPDRLRAAARYLESHP